MKLKFRQHFIDHLDDWRDGNVSAGHRRALAVQWFSEAVEEFQRVGRLQIVHAHERCGTGLRFNGSEDHKIRIDGYEGDINI